MTRAIVGILFTCAALHAQSPDLIHAQLQERVIQGEPLAFLREMVAQQKGSFWFGYAVEGNQSEHNGCCCENGRQTASQKPYKLEGSKFLILLYRVENNVIGRIHFSSENCPLDAGGLRVIWLTGVSSAASLAFLSENVKEGDSALAAIAMHASPEADTILERFSALPHPEALREKALFWLASARDSRGFEIVKRVAEADPSADIREKAMFDLSISKEPAAIDELIRFARSDSNAAVRGQAIFWLAQKAGARAIRAIQDSIQNDPDTEVKKKAVFALQQLPKDEGIPLLIEVAKMNRNPEVRKQAVFWLGQSGDPRALQFLVDILKGKS